MLTYHQVQGYLQKSAALSNDLRRLKELIMPVLQMFETIDRQNEELGEASDVMRGEIRAVEVLGEIIKKHVYGQTTRAGAQTVAVSPSSDGDPELRAAVEQAGGYTRGPGDYII